MELRPEEKAWFEAEGEKLAFKGTPYYLALASESEALRRQVVPRSAELEFLDSESPDPLSEEIHSPLPRMVHRYRNRIALLLTDSCALHCRHCFRRSFTGKNHRNLTTSECEQVIDYVNSHPEVQEILITGGDPLTLSTGYLRDILGRFRGGLTNQNIIFRMATRVPAVLPDRIDQELLDLLKENHPLWMVIQFNHPDELTHDSRSALKRIREAGIPMVNQSVLLSGINDDSDILAALFQQLLAEGVKPYYLFQGDLARGTSHFRAPLERGWKIMDELRLKVSGLALPTYAVDLPGGGGKIPLSRSLLVEEREEGYVFKNSEESKELYIYPREDR